ncbi:HD domain-containing phosphohydrolase [Peptococcaceae bacterium 1198_IL3148]
MFNDVRKIFKLLPLDLQVHSQNVAFLSSLFAHSIDLNQNEIHKVWFGGLVHDIGKICVDKAIIYKSGRLTENEYDDIKRHCYYGEQMLLECDNLASLIPVVKYHHEKWDGSGYYGLIKDDIPLEARIICIADCFDAMTSERSYKEEMPINNAIKELVKCSGTQFDPDLALHFIKYLGELVNFNNELCTLSKNNKYKIS